MYAKRLRGVCAGSFERPHDVAGGSLFSTCPALSAHDARTCRAVVGVVVKVVLVVVTVVVSLARVVGLRMVSDAGASGAGLVLVAAVVLGSVCSGSDGLVVCIGVVPVERT